MDDDNQFDLQRNDLMVGPDTRELTPVEREELYFWRDYFCVTHAEEDGISLLGVALIGAAIGAGAGFATVAFDWLFNRDAAPEPEVLQEPPILAMAAQDLKALAREECRALETR